MQNIKQFIANKKIYVFTLLVPVIILGASLIVLNSKETKDENITSPVLGVKTESPTATPTPTFSPTPTLVPTVKPKVFVPTKTPTPTPTSAPSNNSPTATPTPGQNSNNNPTNTPTPTLEPTATPTPTPTPVADQVTVKAGADIWVTALNPGENAFDVIKRAVGDGLTYDTYDCCGAFITGFHGEKAVYPQWWEFFVNGVSSSVGVSGYNPVNGDVLEFVYHES